MFLNDFFKHLKDGIMKCILFLTKIVQLLINISLLLNQKNWINRLCQSVKIRLQSISYFFLQSNEKGILYLIKYGVLGFRQ